MSLMTLLGEDPTLCPHSIVFVVVVAVVVVVVAVVVVVVVAVVGTGSMHSAVH